jgi:hypothetical protein
MIEHPHAYELECPLEFGRDRSVGHARFGYPAWVAAALCAKAARTVSRKWTELPSIVPLNKRWTAITR